MHAVRFVSSLYQRAMLQLEHVGRQCQKGSFAMVEALQSPVVLAYGSHVLLVVVLLVEVVQAAVVREISVTVASCK